jgi:hypothetical protein
MKRFALVLLISAVTVAQEHAPTVEQCRADAAVWADADFTIPTMKELLSRSKEMSDCLKVDPLKESHEAGMKYIEFSQRFSVEYQNRTVHFLDRHDPAWYQKFLAEDAAGQR